LFRSNPDTTIILRNGLSVHNIKFDSIAKWYNLPVNLELNHKNNYISFNFSAISHTQNNRILYQYKLEGVDQRWNNPTYRTEASYGNLSPGKYTFKLRAVNSLGEQGKETRFSFTINPPWYKTSLFYIIIVSLTIFFIVIYVRQRVKNVTMEKLRLEKLVDEKTKELKERNNQLESSNLEKDKFFSIIAHDLKGPFNGFLGLTQILSESLENLSSDDIKEIACNMRSSASNLYSLLENLLQWSRLKRSSMPFNPEPLLISETINNNISSLLADASTKRITIQNSTAKEQMINADKNMFLTVIRNLISNAIKFTPLEGTISITSSRSNGYVQISVKDSGIGMNKDIVDNLFKLNMVSKRNGTEGEPSSGLGLVISREFIEKHGGTLWVESEENKGSIFHFTIPSH
jgi:signal transduction histidine kinase